MKKSMIIAAFMTLTLMGMLMPLTPITAEGAEEGTHPPPPPKSLAVAPVGIFTGAWRWCFGTSEEVNGIPVDTINDLTDDSVKQLKAKANGTSYDAAAAASYGAGQAEKVYQTIRMNQMLEAADAYIEIDYDSIVVELQEGSELCDPPAAVIMVEIPFSIPEDVQRRVFMECQDRDDVVLARRYVRGVSMTVPYRLVQGQWVPLTDDNMNLNGGSE